MWLEIRPSNFWICEEMTQSGKLPSALRRAPQWFDPMKIFAFACSWKACQEGFEWIIGEKCAKVRSSAIFNPKEKRGLYKSVERMQLFAEEDFFFHICSKMQVYVLVRCNQERRWIPYTDVLHPKIGVLCYSTTRNEATCEICIYKNESKYTQFDYFHLVLVVAVKWTLLIGWHSRLSALRRLQYQKYLCRFVLSSNIFYCSFIYAQRDILLFIHWNNI